LKYCQKDEATWIQVMHRIDGKALTFWQRACMNGEANWLLLADFRQMFPEDVYEACGCIQQLVFSRVENYFVEHGFYENVVQGHLRS
jgi:hypothetical protein